MKVDSSLRGASLLVLAVFGTALLAIFPTRVGGQDANSRWESDLRDLTAKREALMNDSTDFLAVAKSLPVDQTLEINNLLGLNQIVTHGVFELDATFFLLSVYSRMQCDPDRAIAKDALKNRLGFYSILLGVDVDQTTHVLASTKLPATAQSGLRLRDELRAAKSKLDAIAASLE